MFSVFDTSQWRILYYRFRETQYYPVTLSVVILLVSIILTFYIIIPQLSEWLSVRREIEKTQKSISTMKESSVSLRKLGKAKVEEYVQIATSALPFEKDFVGIYNALNETSFRTGIALSDFSISIGDISQNDSSSEITPFITLNLALTTDAYGAKRFIDELARTVPISEVESWNSETSQTYLKISFHYRGIPNITIDPRVAISELSTEEKNLLTMLAEWKPKPLVFEPLSEGSDSSRLNLQPL